MFFEQFKNDCANKNTSPSAVCVAVGIGKSNVTHWRAGSFPKMELRIKLAEYLGYEKTRYLTEGEKIDLNMKKASSISLDEAEKLYELYQNADEKTRKMVEFLLGKD